MGSIDRSCRFHPIFCANQCQIPICFFTERIILIEEGALKPPILKPWHSVVQPVDQKACVLADIAISKGNGGLDVFNGYRLCFSLHRQATPRERIIATVRIFSEKGKASLSQPAEARSCPLRFRRGKTSSTPHKRMSSQENLSNSFPSLPHLTGMSCRFLSRHLHFSHSMLWGERSLSLYYPTTYTPAIGLLQKAAFSGKR